MGHFPTIRYIFKVYFSFSGFYFLYSSVFHSNLSFMSHVKNRIPCLNKWKNCKISSLVQLHTHRLYRINALKSTEILSYSFILHKREHIFIQGKVVSKYLLVLYMRLFKETFSLFLFPYMPPLLTNLRESMALINFYL